MKSAQPDTATPSTPLLRRASAGAATLIVLILAVVLVYTGAQKALNLNGFTNALSSHALLHDDAVAPAAWAVTTAELLTGAASLLAIAVGCARSLAAIATGATFLTFAAYSAALVLTPPPTPAPCGCGLPNASPIEDWRPLAVTNASVAIVALGAALVLRRAPSPGPASPRRRASSHDRPNAPPPQSA